MNWSRTILDGFAMAAYFNVFAAAVALYNPRLMFPCYPPAIIRDAPEPPTKAENRFYWLWICFGELLPLLIYGAVSMAEGGTHGFWQMALTGYIQWMIGKPVRPVFSGHLSHPEKGEAPFCHSRYGRAPRLWVPGVDEKLCLAGASAAMAADLLPPDGGSTGRTWDAA